jgi:hypothetical protein
MASVGTVKFEGTGGAVLARLDDPSWAYASECLWNPEWRLLEVVSLGDLITGDPASRWCPGGSQAVGGEPITQVAGFARSTLCDDLPFNSGLQEEKADCVYGDDKSGETRLTMVPTKVAAVSLQGASRIRVTVPMGLGPADSLAAGIDSSSCLSATYINTGLHELVLPDQAGDPVETRPMLGPSLVRLLFFNEAGTLLTSSSLDDIVAPDACASTLDWTTANPESLLTLQARPTLDASPASPHQRLRLTAEAAVPQEATHVSVAVWVKTIDDKDFYEPVVGSIAIEAALEHDPAWVPALHDGNDAAFLQHQPYRCGSSAWYHRSAEALVDAGVNAPQTIACYQDFAGVEP